MVMRMVMRTVMIQHHIDEAGKQFCHELELR